MRAKWHFPRGAWNNFSKAAIHFFRGLCFFAGLLALGMAVLAFTAVPYHAYRWLGTHGGLAGAKVDLIFLLSGSGMPSGPELMRCQQAATLAKIHPDAPLVLLLPHDTALANAMRSELELRHVAPERIHVLLHGRNTREQALDAAAHFNADLHSHVVLVTSPEHTYRSLLSFRKVGFFNAQGAPAFEHALFSDLHYDRSSMGGSKLVPDVAGSYGLRYNFWNYLKLEITCLREYAAIGYYRLNGWI